MGYVLGLHLSSNEDLRVTTIREKQNNIEVFTTGSVRLSGLLLNSILCGTAITFVSGSICAPTLAAFEYEAHANEININLNDIAFLTRIEKLYEKAKRYKDKLDSGKLIGVMFEIKCEVEGYTGKRVNLGAQVDQIEKDAKKQGAKFKSGEIKAIKKIL